VIGGSRKAQPSPILATTIPTTALLFCSRSMSTRSATSADPRAVSSRPAPQQAPTGDRLQQPLVQLGPRRGPAGAERARHRQPLIIGPLAAVAPDGQAHGRHGDRGCTEAEPAGQDAVCASAGHRQPQEEGEPPARNYQARYPDDPQLQPLTSAPPSLRKSCPQRSPLRLPTPRRDGPTPGPVADVTGCVHLWKGRPSRGQPSPDNQTADPGHSRGKNLRLQSLCPDHRSAGRSVPKPCTRQAAEASQKSGSSMCRGTRR
jgi:hypothetical protein